MLISIWEQSNVGLIFIVVIGLLATVISIYRYLKKIKSVDSDESINADECAISEAMESWFEKMLQTYAKRYCACLLEQARLRSNLSIAEVKPLRDKYGVERIFPDLFLEMKFTESFPSADMDALKVMQKGWLDKEGVPYKKNSMSETIAHEIEQKITLEFRKEFDSFYERIKNDAR